MIILKGEVRLTADIPGTNFPFQPLDHNHGDKANLSWSPLPHGYPPKGLWDRWTDDMVKGCRRQIVEQSARVQLIQPHCIIFFWKHYNEEYKIVSEIQHNFKVHFVSVLNNDRQQFLNFFPPQSQKENNNILQGKSRMQT